MAAQDLQVRPATSITQHVPATPPRTAPLGQPAAPPSSLLANLIVKRWWLLLLVAVASLGVAWVLADRFGRVTAFTEGAIIRLGLPLPPGPEVYSPPRMRTYQDLLLSLNMLEKLRAQRGIEIPAKTLAEMFVCRVTRDSNLLNLELTWPVASEATDVLNDFMEMFIEEVAENRRAVLRDHMKHVEVALLSAQQDVAAARRQLSELRDRRQAALEESGLSTDRVENLWDNISKAEMDLELKQAELLGVDQQLKFVEEQIAEWRLQFRGRVVLWLQDEITQQIQLYSQSSERAQELAQTRQQLSHLASTEVTEVEWLAGLQRITHELELTVDDGVSFDSASELHIEDLVRRRTELALTVLPLKNQIEVLQRRFQEKQSEFDKLAAETIDVSIEDVEEHERLLAEAEAKQGLQSRQLESMQQLEQCRVRELAVSLPASESTTQVWSNRKKIMAAGFLGSSMVLMVPILLGQWLAGRKSRVQMTAERLGVPVIAERLLHDFNSRARGRAARRGLSNRVWEQLRLLALRIQQATHRRGAVILFSGATTRVSPVRLMAAIAECLGEREERVLIVDAIDPRHDSSRLAVRRFLPLESEHLADRGPATPETETAEAELQADGLGLSEYLAGELDDLSQLARPSGIPGIDVITSGSDWFPPEAMASGRLTALFDRCRHEYTMILVHAPATVSEADIQMLSARADGIVLAMDRKSAGDQASAEAIAELLDLGAPVIGVVS